MQYPTTICQRRILRFQLNLEFSTSCREFNLAASVSPRETLRLPYPCSPSSSTLQAQAAGRVSGSRSTSTPCPALNSLFSRLWTSPSSRATSCAHVGERPAALLDDYELLLSLHLNCMP